MHGADFSRAIHYCLPKRSTQTNPKTGVRQSDEYNSAETIAAELFRRDFEDRYAGAELFFTTQREYLSTRSTRSVGIEFILNMMKEHFRNWVSPRNPMREGGFRKPDGLCIAARGYNIVIELLEVKPAADESKGKTQIQDMLRRLHAGLDEALQQQHGQTRFSDGDFSIVATEWRPTSDQMVCPLLNPRETEELTWACFWQMSRRARVDGVLLYELHSLSFKSAATTLRNISVNIQNRIRRAYEVSSDSTVSQTSWQHNYCKANTTDVEILRKLAEASSWSDLAAGLSLVLNDTNKIKARAAARGGLRALLESSSPLSVTIGGKTIVEPAIESAIGLANSVRMKN